MRTARQALWAAAETAVPALVAMIVTPQLVSGLGPDRYGLMLLAIGMAGLGALAEMGLSIIGARELSQARGRHDPQRFREVLWTLISVYLVVGGSVGALGFLAARPLARHVLEVAPPLLDAATQVLRWAGPAALLQLILSLAFAYFRSAERFDITARLTLVLTLPQQALIVWFARAGDLTSTVATALGWPLLTTAVLTSIAIRQDRRWLKPTAPSWGLLRYMLGLSSWQFLAAGCYRAGEQAPRLALTRWFGPSALAAFSVPMSLVQQLQILVAGSSQMLLTRVAALTAKGELEAARTAVRIGTKWVVFLATAGFVPLSCLSQSLLESWLGASFAEEAAGQLRVLCIAGIAGACRIALTNVLYGVGETRAVLVAEGLRALLGVAGLAVALPLMGEQGAAWAWLLSWSSLAWNGWAVRHHLRGPGVEGVAMAFLLPAVIAVAIGMAIRSLMPTLNQGPTQVLLVLGSSGLCSLATIVIGLALPWTFGRDAAFVRALLMQLVARLFPPLSAR